MIRKVRFLTLLLVLALALATLASCAGQPSATTTAAPTQAATETSAPAETTAAPVTLKVGATPVPHAEILKIAQAELLKQNINLEIVEYTDYVQPNLALDSKELDANFFQHLPYLLDFNAKNGTRLVSLAAVHFEPLGLYPGRTKNFADLKDGAMIAVPNDTTNEARALLLLQAQGLIELPADAGLEVTPKDITANPKNLKFTEVEAAQIARALPDVDAGVVNGNYAIEAGLTMADALAAEAADSIAAQTFGNILTIREGDEARPELVALADALKSQAVKDFIASQYAGSVVSLG
ncbi:MAG: metal ABC transporter substrate-binding protein [Clostridia bacterium]|nr:metal ABC transporter substrate-binding protein [Clostridia bacterium]